LEPRISLITLGVRDLERARRFYRDGLGLPERTESNDRVSFLQLRGLVLALYGRADLARDAGLEDDGSGFSGVSIAHNVSSREAVTATLVKVVGAGATLVKPGEDTFWGGYVGYFADPDGYLWEVAWNPGMPELAQ
jgi:uncharacterized protein